MCTRKVSSTCGLGGIVVLGELQIYPQETIDLVDMNKHNPDRL